MQGDHRDHSALDGLFEDLEQQAAGLHLSDRDAEVADRARGEYAAVTLADRVHASLGRRIRLRLYGGVLVEGRADRAGVDWVHLVGEAGVLGGAEEWMVRLAALESAGGMSSRALPESARPVTARLGFGSAARGWAEHPGEVGVHLVGGGRRAVRISRVGADFLEVVDDGGVASVGDHDSVLLPFATVAALRRG